MSPLASCATFRLNNCSRTNKTMHFLSIVGARPQFVKVAVVAEALRRHNESVASDRQIRHTIVHTGQHYDEKMSDSFFQELGIPAPEHNLEVGSGSHGKQTGAMLERIEEVLVSDQPDAVIVYGDTNSTVAGALAAAKLHIPVAHVEAGLRSFNRLMPEEINRVVTDHLSQVLLCPTETAVRNLAKEGIEDGVFVVGDVMLDAVMHWRDTATLRSTVLHDLGLRRGGYVLLTLHRAENTSDTERLQEILSAVLDVRHPVVFPMHPRTRESLKKNAELEGFAVRLAESETIKVIEPVSYLEMLALEDNARIVVTDSGGVQKEAYFLGVPCITVRHETEWVETLAGGWNRLVEPGRSRVADIVEQLWNQGDSYPKCKPDLSRFGQGRASMDIVKATLAYLNGVESGVHG